MENWMLLKEKGHNFFKIKDYQKASDCYKEALADIENKFDESKPELKIEGSKIASNISLMYFKLSEENNDESLLLQSKLYAKKTIKYNPEWVKGYRRLQEVCKEEGNLDDVLETVSIYLQDNKDCVLNDDFYSLVVDIKYYTHRKIMKKSPSWDLLKYPENVCVVDPLGAGNFRNFQEFLNYYGTSVKEISVLIRPGIYIGTFVLTNADIDIVGDCEVEINPTTKAIDKDPTIVFKNTNALISLEMWVKQQQIYDHTYPPSTFYFKRCRVSMKRVSVIDEIMHHPINAIISDDSNIRTFESSFFSKFSAGYFCVYSSKLYCKGCRFVGSFSGVIAMTADCVKLTDCFISETVGMGIEVRAQTKKITLKNCTIIKCKKQGITVYNGSEIVIISDCHFEGNCSAMTVNEGSIQLAGCKAFVANTTIKNQNSTGIVIEGGTGNFENILVENCFNGFLLSAKVQIVNSTIQNCLFCAFQIYEHYSVVLENNTIHKCMHEITKSVDAAMPVFKGAKVHKIKLFDLAGDLHKSIAKRYRKSRSKRAPKGFNIGPVGDVLNINDRASLFFNVSSVADSCEYCGHSEIQLKRKLKACGGCKLAFYCSPECQKKAWKIHRPTCVTVAKTTAKQTEEGQLSNRNAVDDEECSDCKMQ